jgi:hypothetical protein
MKKLLEANVAYGRRRIAQVFADFCELAALAIRNSVDLHDHATREARYVAIANGYTPEEMSRFAELLAKLTMKLDDELDDILGHLYMSLDLGSDHIGQFFTPYHVSQLMAQIICPDYAAKLETEPFITLLEPTCGSGGMIIAVAETMRAAGFNYQQQIHVTAQDIDTTAVHMTFITLSLLHIPAVIIHGDTLTLEVRDRWATPAHILGNWDYKLNARAASKKLTVIAKELAVLVDTRQSTTDLPADAELPDSADLDTAA